MSKVSHEVIATQIMLISYINLYQISSWTYFKYVVSDRFQSISYLYPNMVLFEVEVVDFKQVWMLQEEVNVRTKTQAIKFHLNLFQQACQKFQCFLISQVKSAQI